MNEKLKKQMKDMMEKQKRRQENFDELQEMSNSRLEDLRKTLV